jgi:hypothetical protein
MKLSPAQPTKNQNLIHILIKSSIRRGSKVTSAAKSPCQISPPNTPPHKKKKGERGIKNPKTKKPTKKKIGVCN